MATYKKLQVVELSKDFRKATRVVEEPVPTSAPDGCVLVKTHCVGINATDINVTNGGYGVSKPPFTAGLEAVGVVEKVGAGITHLKPGDAVIMLQPGSFAEYVIATPKTCLPIPALKAELLTLSISGLTAMAALSELGQPKEGDVALVTAAAGGTGQFAVQLLKHHFKCTVIGTCSSADKASFLKSLGCDHVINYKTENVSEALTNFAPNGLDVVYECVGGDLFNTALQHTAQRGRFITIGAISGYKSGEFKPFQSPSGLPMTLHLLTKSISLRGFMLSHFAAEIPKYFKELLTLSQAGTIKLNLDAKTFKGVASIADAVDYLYTGQSIGKVVVHI